MKCIEFCIENALLQSAKYPQITKCYASYDEFLSHYMEGISHHFQNFSLNLKCCWSKFMLKNAFVQNLPLWKNAKREISLFSAPEPKAQVHYCDHALSIVRPSVVLRLSSLTFHIFDFSSETAEQNLTKLNWKRDLNVLYQVCVFRADRKNKMAALASDWLRHFWLLWNHWTEFNETWQ